MRDDAGENEGWTENDFLKALEAAGSVIKAERFAAPFSHRVFNYWSPDSMVPKGSLPRWNWSRLRCFTVPGVDPLRFVFAEHAPGHRMAGNSRVFDFAELF